MDQPSTTVGPDKRRFALGPRLLGAMRADRVLFGLGLLLGLASLHAYLAEVRFVALDSEITLGDVSDSKRLELTIPVFVTAFGEHHLVAQRSGTCCALPVGGASRTGPGYLGLRFVVDTGAKPPGSYSDRVPVTLSSADREATKLVTIRYRVVRSKP